MITTCQCGYKGRASGNSGWGYKFIVDKAQSIIQRKKVGKWASLCPKCMSDELNKPRKKHNFCERTRKKIIDAEN